MITLLENTQDKALIEISVETVNDDIAMELKSLCRKVLDENPRDIYFRMADVRHMVSSGIGVFLYLIQRLRREKKRIIIETCTDDIKKVFNSLLLNTFIEIQ